MSRTKYQLANLSLFLVKLFISLQWSIKVVANFVDGELGKGVRFTKLDITNLLQHEYECRGLSLPISDWTGILVIFFTCFDDIGEYMQAHDDRHKTVRELDDAKASQSARKHRKAFHRTMDHLAKRADIAMHTSYEYVSF